MTIGPPTNSFLLPAGLLLLLFIGFALRQSGLSRSKTPLAHSALLLCVTLVAYALIGFSLMFPDRIWAIFRLIAAPDFIRFSATQNTSTLAAQALICTIPVMIVAGTLAERIKLLPLLIFAALLSAIIYPIQASWMSEGGILAWAGFIDFAGATTLHSVGGWAALTGAIVLGPRLGKFADGEVTPFPISSLPLATFATLLLWLGWIGLNGGAQITTHTAALAGLITALLTSLLLFKKLSLPNILNGALAGLVSIAAEPLAPTIPMAALIGGVGGLIVALTIPMLEKFRIDDVIGAIPVHLVAGIWGTIAVIFTNPNATIDAQLFGILAIAVFVIITSTAVWLLLNLTLGLRASLR